MYKRQELHTTLQSYYDSNYTGLFTFISPAFYSFIRYIAELNLLTPLQSLSLTFHHSIPSLSDVLQLLGFSETEIKVETVVQQKSLINRVQQEVH